ncbi:MAG: hypothetical protein H7249_12795 [Chitinophagaceae bacterium]|nr:hypothetical protein [Oligoflexus sp.]
MASNSNQGRGQDGKKVDKNIPAHSETEGGRHAPADPHKAPADKGQKRSK